MPKPQYTTRDSFENLDRQDKRQDNNDLSQNLNNTTKSIPIQGNSRGEYRKRYQDGDIKTPHLVSSPIDSIIPIAPKDPLAMSEDSFDPEEQLPDPLKIFNFYIGQFKTLPSFLKTSILKLAKQKAITKCKILNIQTKTSALTLDKESNTLPNHMKHQRKLVEKFHDINIVHKLTVEFIDAEYTVLNDQKTQLEHELEDRYFELSELLAPIKTNSTLLNTQTIEFQLILDSLIEQEFCSMLIKQRDDMLRKHAKREKFETKKAQNNEPATITVRELEQLKRSVKNINKSKIRSKTPPSNPKNGKGKSGKKKTVLPKKSKSKPKGNQPKNPSTTSKKGGNTKNSKGTRQ